MKRQQCAQRAQALLRLAASPSKRGHEQTATGLQHTFTGAQCLPPPSSHHSCLSHGPLLSLAEKSPCGMVAQVGKVHLPSPFYSPSYLQYFWTLLQLSFQSTRAPAPHSVCHLVLRAETGGALAGARSCWDLLCSSSSSCCHPSGFKQLAHTRLFPKISAEIIELFRMEKAFKIFKSSNQSDLLSPITK